jgi:CDP-diacylglycerol---glycerol-3-phosphate 3-phosphatidyltransferase
MNIPNWLTVVRIIAIPVLVVIYYLPFPWAHFAAALLFVFAALTDWLDGYLARHLHQGTRFGAFLDPVADKLIVAVALVLIVAEIGSAYIAIPAAIIVGREIVISGLREWMAEIGKRTSVAVSRMAKIKTVVQMLSLIFLLWYTPQSFILIKIVGVILLYIAAALTLWSMIMYLRTAWPDLKP